MKDKYFDLNEYLRIMDLRDVDLYECIRQLEIYISRYPNDYEARSKYASLLISIKKIDAAKDVMYKLIDDSNKDEEFNKNKKKVYILRGNIVYNKSKLYMYQEKYFKCYKLLKKERKTINDNNLKFQIPYTMCRKKIDFKPYFEGELKDDYYGIKQIISYNENYFKDMMKSHLESSDIKESEKSTVIFNRDFPFDKIYEYLKNKEDINRNKNKLYLGFVDDTNYYKFDRCGTVDGIETNYFKAVAYHNTNDYIIIRPTIEGEFMPHTDLNDLREKKRVIIYRP